MFGNGGHFSSTSGTGLFVEDGLIVDSGKTGIRTTTPSTTLDVAGRVRVEEGPDSNALPSDGMNLSYTATTNEARLEVYNQSVSLGDLVISAANLRTGQVRAAGSVTAHSFQLTTPEERILPVPASAFIHNDNCDFDAPPLTAGVITINATGFTCEANAPVVLPQGAVIEKIEWFVRDNNTDGEDIEVTFFTSDPLGGWSIIRQSKTTNESLTTQVLNQDNLGVQVDNIAHFYHLHAKWHIGTLQSGSTINLGGARVYYTIDSL